MRRGIQPRDETGAALVVALIFVTVVGLGTAMLLSFTDTNIRTTVSLREQSARAYAADGAAQVAVNALRQSTFTNAEKDATCAGSDLPMSLPQFSTGTTAAKSVSTLVTCERKLGVAATVVQPDPVQKPAVINANNTPKFGLLALSSTPTTEDGITVNGANTSDVLNVKGKIATNTTVKVNKGSLQSDTSVNAFTSCTGTVVAPTKSCSGTSQAWPQYDAPTAAAVAAATPAQDIPSCPSTGGLVTFSPGLYTNATALSACDKANITMWFKPGTYYFNFPSSTPKWTLDLGSMVAGTPTADISKTVPVMPGSCVNPLAPASGQYTPPTANAGVQFVFAGYSQWVVGGSAQVEVCGSYSATVPPIAIFGLQMPIGTPPGTALGSLPAQSNCVILVTNACPFISSTTNANDTNSLYVQGTVYATKALLSLTESRAGARRTTMAFNGGVVVRSLIASTDSVTSSVLPSAIAVPTATPVPPLVSQTPIPQPNLPEVVVLLKVYTCSGTRACTTDDRLGLTAKVGISNPATGAVVGGARSVSIYSWATQR